MGKTGIRKVTVAHSIDTGKRTLRFRGPMAGCPPYKQHPGGGPHGAPGSPDPYGILYGPNCAFWGSRLGTLRRWAVGAVGVIGLIGLIGLIGALWPSRAGARGFIGRAPLLGGPQVGQ